MEVYVLSIVKEKNGELDIEHEVYQGASESIQRLEELAHLDQGIIPYYWLADIDGWDPTDPLPLILSDDNAMTRFQLRKATFKPISINTSIS